MISFLLVQFFQIILYGFVLAIVLFIAYKFYQGRNNTRSRILLEYLENSENKHLDEERYEIRFTEDDRFRRFWKMFPWSGSGWLINRKDEVVALLEKGMIYDEMIFPRNTSILEWEGLDIWKNGIIHWFSIESEGNIYHITNESGTTIIGSKAGTKEIYEGVKFRD
jgi:hypothetical protein